MFENTENKQAKNIVRNHDKIEESLSVNQVKDFNYARWREEVLSTDFSYHYFDKLFPIKDGASALILSWMENRILMGSMRYGRFKKSSSPYDFAKEAIRRSEKIKSIPRDMELIVDVLNLDMLNCMKRDSLEASIVTWQHHLLLDAIDMGYTILISTDDGEHYGHEHG
jgi:hypothetical protein